MPQSTYQMKNVWHTLNAQRLLQLVFPESLGEMTCEDPKETEVSIGVGSKLQVLPLEPLCARAARLPAGSQALGLASQPRRLSCAARWEPEPESEPEPPAGAASRKPRAGSRSRSRAEAEHARCGDGGLLLHILMGLSGADRTLYCLQLGPGASFKFMATLLLDDCNYFCQPVDYNRASSGWRACAGGATQRLLSL
ncbi:uncharacterized protein LOC144374099 [Ictidomys tridecemlineatus]